MEQRGSRSTSESNSTQEAVCLDCPWQKEDEVVKKQSAQQTQEIQENRRPGELRLPDESFFPPAWTVEKAGREFYRGKTLEEILAHGRSFLRR